MSITFGDVILFLKKNNYSKTLETIQQETVTSSPIDPMLESYEKLKISEKKWCKQVVKLTEKLVIYEPNQGHEEFLESVKKSKSLTSRSSTLKRNPQNNPDSAKVVDIPPNILDSLGSGTKYQLKQVLDICKLNKLDNLASQEIIDGLMESRKWSTTDAKILLSISRYSRVRNQLEPVLVLESLQVLVRSKPYIQAIALKTLSYLSYHWSFIEDIQTRNLLDAFQFYSIENTDMEGLATLLLNLSEKSNYLVQHPQSSINLILDVFEFGSEKAKAQGLITLHNIAHTTEIKSICQKIEIESILATIATPKLATAIDYLTLKLAETKSKEFDFLQESDALDLDEKLVEDLYLLVSL